MRLPRRVPLVLITGGAGFIGSHLVREFLDRGDEVVAIDKATRTVTLKGPKGDVRDIVASDEVKNFDQVKVGDFLVVRYAQALTLELKKTKVKATGNKNKKHYITVQKNSPTENFTRSTTSKNGYHYHI